MEKKKVWIVPLTVRDTYKIDQIDNWKLSVDGHPCRVNTI